MGVAIATALEMLEPDTPATRSGGEEDAQLARTRLYRSVIDMLAAVRSAGRWPCCSTMRTGSTRTP